MAEPRKVWYAPNKFEAYGEEEIQAVNDCLRAGWLAGNGPLTEQFEAEVAAYFGKKFGVFVNSGSSANTLALHIARLKPGDEVVTPALTFSTTIAPIVQMGAVPVFCDSVLDRYVPSVEQVLAAMTPNTKAIFIPNLVGSKPDWDALRAALPSSPAPNALLIEDSCDTMTHTPSTDISVVSFYSSHVITAGGGGGMVMMNKEEQRVNALQFRDWGRMGNNTEDTTERFGHFVDDIEYDFKFVYVERGFNFKSTEMNAAFGLAQMKKLDGFTAIRAKLALRYIEKLKDNTNLIIPNNEGKYNWMAMPLQTARKGDRKRLLIYLEENGVQTRVCFAGNITRHLAYREFFKEFEVADRVMANGFLLGNHHGMTVEDVDRVCDLLNKFDYTQ